MKFSDEIIMIARDILSKEGFVPLADIAKKIKIGDIYKVDDNKKLSVITVVAISKPDGFYYYTSKPNGNPISKRNFHSNMFKKTDTFKKIGEKKFHKIIKVKGFEWIQTGDKAIDTDLAQLDQRWAFFSKFATPELMKRFKAQENRNQHTENAEMINAFAEWISKGKKPEDFKY